MVRYWLAGAIAVISIGCTSYTGVSRHEDDIYLTGVLTIFGLHFPWLRKCKEEKGRLICEELDVDLKRAPPMRRGRPAVEPPPEEI